MGKISEKCKSYLKRENFVLGLDTPRYKKRVWFDFFVVLAYAVISVVIIWMKKEADMVVLLLNILCLLRALIESTIKAAEATKSIYKTGIEEKHKTHSHYHRRDDIIGAVFSMTVLLYVALHIESANIITKVLATVSIFVVWCNDVDNMIIDAYDARVYKGGNET